MAKPTVDLPLLQNQAGVVFRDQSLLLRSLTHPSYVNEHPEQGLQDNERLEFLGDAVLDFISGDWLYNRFPEADEGYLTRLRAALVRTETLADFARKCNIGSALLLGKGEHDSHGSERDGNLCAAFEALVGALYLDSDIEDVRRFVFPFFDVALEEILRLDLDKDPKSLLQETCQASFGTTPSYITLKVEGPDHARSFTVAVVIGEVLCAQGVGHSKQLATQDAARRALVALSEFAQ